MTSTHFRFCHSSSTYCLRREQQFECNTSNPGLTQLLLYGDVTNGSHHDHCSSTMQVESGIILFLVSWFRLWLSAVNKSVQRPNKDSCACLCEYLPRTQLRKSGYSSCAWGGRRCPCTPFPSPPQSAPHPLLWSLCCPGLWLLCTNRERLCILWLIEDTPRATPGTISRFPATMSRAKKHLRAFRVPVPA